METKKMEEILSGLVVGVLIGTVLIAVTAWKLGVFTVFG